MPKVITKVSHRKVENPDGTITTIYTKRCPHCKKEYETTSRSQKFCSVECGKKYSKRIKTSRIKYDETKAFERIRSRSHALAVSVLELYSELGIREKKCAICGETEGLECHHTDHFSFLNNNPDQLQWLCKSCHSKEHSRVEAELNEKGVLLEEWYHKSMEPFYKALGMIKTID